MNYPTSLNATTLAMTPDELKREAEIHRIKNDIPWTKERPHPQRRELSRPWLDSTRAAVGW